MSESQQSMAKARAVMFAGLKCTPKSARHDLVNTLGYPPEAWERILHNDGTSHGLRATILIAMGDTRTLPEIVEALSVEELV